MCFHRLPGLDFAWDCHTGELIPCDVDIEEKTHGTILGFERLCRIAAAVRRARGNSDGFCLKDVAALANLEFLR